MHLREIFRSDKDDIHHLVEWMAARYDWQTAAMSQELIEALHTIRSHKKMIIMLWLLFGCICLVLGYDAGIVLMRNNLPQAFVIVHTTLVVSFVVIMTLVLFWGTKQISSIAQTIATDKEKEFWAKYPNFNKEIRNQIYEAIVS